MKNLKLIAIRYPYLALAVSFFLVALFALAVSAPVAFFYGFGAVTLLLTVFEVYRNTWGK